MADEQKCPHCGKPVTPTALQGICPECMLKAGFATQTEGAEAAGAHGTRILQPPPQPAEIASLFPQLEILECLGRGGMGVVYKARQPRLNRLVALKILARDKEHDPQFAQRFVREAQTLAQLNHPNIVAVYDFGEVGQASSLSPSVESQRESETGRMPVPLYYLLMEYVDGVSLRQLLQSGKVEPVEALAIVPRICEALQYAHEKGIVHRDIKPENILMDKAGRVKIADFGIAKMLGGEPGQQTLTGAKDVMGTPHYMAPEQIEKPTAVDHRADIYSLGVVFYEMLTGELPLGRFAAPSKKVHVDVRLDEVVLRTLEKEPERRYQQASEVKTRVETIASTSGRESAPTEPSEIGNRESQMPSRFSRTAIVGACWAGIAALTFLLNYIGINLMFLSAALLPALVVTAPFGTTILGWISVSQIRHSAGKLHGMRLAAFDGLFFPLLALDALLILLIWIALPDVRNLLMDAFQVGLGYHRTGLALTVAAGIVAVLLIVDFLVVRVVWRAMKKPLTNCQTSPAPGVITPPLRSTSAWKVVAVVVAGALLVLAIPVGSILLAVYLPYYHSKQARYQSVVREPQAEAVVRVQETLRHEIEARMEQAGYKPDSVSVNVSPALDKAECRLGQVSKNGLYSDPWNGSFVLQPQGNGLWLVEGRGELNALRFSVDVSNNPPSVEVQPATKATERAMSFGPVMERTLTSVAFDNYPASQYFDFETGKFYEPPPDLARELRAAVEGAGTGNLKRPSVALLDWLEQTGVDVVAGNLISETELWFIDRSYPGHRTPPLSGPFDSVAPETISTKPLPSTGLYDPLQMHRAPLQRWHYDNKADIIEFRTREGHSGILEVASLAENPRGVKIRYKLVKAESGVQTEP